MIKSCLFDLDGTLLNTLNSIRYYANKNITIRGISEISSEETKAFVGSGARKLIENILEARGYDLSLENSVFLCETIHKKYVKEYDAAPAYLTEPYEGICDAVSGLLSMGISLAVISNKPDPTVRQLVEKFFGNKFLIVEGASDRMPLKPDKAWPLDICRRLGVSPGEVMYVGDTSTDMKTAKNFGAGLSVGVLWGFREKDELIENGADVTVSHPNELVRLVLEKNKA